MKTITIRQLQREFYTHISDLPLVVTKGGKPYLRIESVGDVVTSRDNPTVTPPIVVTSEPPSSYTPCKVCGTKYIKHQGEAYEKYHKGLGDWHEFQA